jgi:hypothetical protein
MEDPMDDGCEIPGPADQSPEAIAQLIAKVRSAREEAAKVGWPHVERALLEIEKEIISEAHDI